MLISRGDPMIVLNRPINLILLIMVVAALVVVLLPSVAKRRKEVFVEQDGRASPEPRRLPDSISRIAECELD